MKIKYLKHAAFLIEANGLKVLTDPHNQLDPIPVDIITQGGSTPFYGKSNLKFEAKRFDRPGEYETKGIHFKGISTIAKREEKEFQATIFKMNFNGVRIAHLSGPGLATNDTIIENIGDIDILFTPVPADAVQLKKVKEMIEDIEPRCIIPMAYQNEDGEDNTASLNLFLQEMGAPGINPLPEFQYKKSELVDESSKVVLLSS